jgi:ABC-type nitrate/sulfonate/bicarbonate transport system substrate-binding protein
MLTHLQVTPPTLQDRRTFLKNLIRAAGASLVVQLLTACAPTSSDPGTGPPAPPTPAAAGQTTAPVAIHGVTSVGYAFGNVNPFHWVALIGKERPELPGTFGIAFDLVTTTNVPNAMNALVGGSVDVAVVTPDGAWPAQDKAPDVKQLFAVGQGTPYVLITQPDIQQVADLQGQTLGASAVKGSPDGTALRFMLHEHGLKDPDYTIVQAGTVADRTAAMKAGAIAAVAQLEPQATLLREAGFREIDNGNHYPSLKNVHALVLVSRQSFYQSKPEVAANFVRAFDAITKWLYDPANKQDVLAITKKTMQVGDGPAQNAYNLHIGQSVPAKDLHIKEVFMQQFVENQKKVGEDQLPTDPMKYVDFSLLDRALNNPAR